MGSDHFSASAARTKRLGIIAVILVMVLALTAGAFCFSNNAATAVTPSSRNNEAAATSDGDVVRVAFFPLDGFYQYDSSKNMTGYGVEYFNAVADAAGIKYKYIPASSWVEALQMFDEGKVDVLAPSQMTSERNEKYRFCPLPIGMEYGSLLTLDSDKSLTYEDYASFKGKKVGCVKSIIFMDSYLDYQKNHGFKTQLEYYKDTQAVVAALKSGDVDAIMVNLMVKTDDMKVLAKFGAAPIYFMVGHDNAQLQAKLNDAMQSFTTTNPSFQAELTDKYFSAFNEAPFTKKELSFAADCDPINVGIASDEAPLAHIDDEGNPCGVEVGMLEAIAKASGLRFNYVGLPEGKIDKKYLEENNIALVAGVESNSANASLGDYRITKPYQSLAKVYVGDPTKTYDTSKTLRVAFVEGLGDNTSALSSDHPNFEFVSYKSTEQCLDAVESGDADLAVQNRYIVERCLSNPHYENLGVLPIQAQSSDDAFALVNSVVTTVCGSNGSDMLKSVIDKSITQIPEEDINELLATEVTENQYRPSLADMAYQYRGPLLVIVISLLIVIAALAFAVHVQARNRRRIEDNEQKLANISNNINGGVLVINGDDSLLITYANDGFLEIIGCSREEFEKVHHNSYLTYVHPDDVSTLKEIAAKPLDEIGDRVSMPLRLRIAEDKYLDTLFSGTIRLSSDGLRNMYCVVTDISEQTHLLNELTLEKNRSELFFRKSDNIIYEVNLKDMTITASDNMEAMLGWTLPETLAEFTRDAFLNMWHADDESKEKLLAAAREVMNKHTDVKCTIQLQTAAGEKLWCEVDQYPMLDKSGELISVIGRILDVDKAMAEKEQLEHLARTDSMTGLLKKEYFAEKTKAYLAEGHTEDCAFLFFDVDHFKEVNDTLGHELGDTCLKDIAHKLSVAFSNVDYIARFGGDEFVVFVKSIPRDTLMDRLEWLEGRLRETYTTGDNSLTITCSIGAACTDDFGSDYDQLIKHADAALYEAKNRGRAQFYLAQP